MLRRLNPGGGAGDVVYANGSGGSPVTGAGEWPQVIANALTCDVGMEGPPASCVVRLGVLGLNPTDASCGNNPVVGQTWNVQISTTPTVGTSTTSTFAALGLGGPTSGFVVFGYELLILPTFLQTAGLGSHNFPIPPFSNFIGANFTLQGARLESGPSAIVLTNALEITIGL